MSGLKYAFVLLVLCIYNQRSDCGRRSNIKVKRAYMCRGYQNFPLTCYIRIRTVNNVQYATANASFKIPIDVNVKVKINAELVGSKGSVHLFTIQTKDACNGLHTLGGELAYDIERSAGLIPGSCPIPRGQYHWIDYEINLDKIKFQIESLPFGRLDIELLFFDKMDTNVGCLMIEVEKV